MTDNNPKYQCPACCWVGTTDDLVHDANNTFVCPNCYVRFSSEWKEQVDE
jgi:predicted RNA-binding Zn-ribbon protein involved in translation (DUF1610 family)